MAIFVIRNALFVAIFGFEFHASLNNKNATQLVSFIHTCSRGTKLGKFWKLSNKNAIKLKI